MQSCLIDIKICSFSIGPNECSSTPCLNGGACNDFEDYYTCTCDAGFTGPTCETGNM